MSEVISISAEALAGLQSRLAQAEASAAAQTAEAAARETKAMIDRGDSQAVLDQHRRELSSVREQASNYATKSALAQSLSKYQLNPHAAEQLEVILGRDLVATASGNGFDVHSKDYRSVDAFVAEKMTSGNYSHFLLKQSALGNQAAPGRPGQPAPVVENAPKNLGEQLRQMQQSATANGVLNNTGARFLHRKSS